MNIAIFASGNGTNFENITRYFAGSQDVKVSLMVCNKANANVIKRAEKLKVPSVCFPTKEWKTGENVLQELHSKDIDFIVLAGFLLLVPELIIDEYSGRIVNIHPALLPKFGGKGMYGSHVHEAVIKSLAKESGITIHYVNKKYDSGQIIKQVKCNIDDNETVESLEAKIHALEKEYYPKVLEKLLIR